MSHLKKAVAWTELVVGPNGTFTLKPKDVVKGTILALRTLEGELGLIGGTQIAMLQGGRYDSISVYFEAVDGRPADVLVKDKVELQRFRRLDGHIYAKNYVVTNRSAKHRPLPSGVWKLAEGLSAFLIERICETLPKPLEAIRLLHGGKTIWAKDYDSIKNSPLGKREGILQVAVKNVGSMYGHAQDYPGYTKSCKQKDPRKPAVLRYRVELKMICYRTRVDFSGKLWDDAMILFEGVTAKEFRDRYSKPAEWQWRARVFREICAKPWLMKIKFQEGHKDKDRVCIDKVLSTDDVVGCVPGPLLTESPALEYYIPTSTREDLGK